MLCCCRCRTEELTPLPVAGFVIANDADAKRSYMLVHQTLRRLCTPNIMVVNHDAAFLPNVMIGEGAAQRQLKFDRILCDVPCSGDGTLRKAPDMWVRWNANFAISLHRCVLSVSFGVNDSYTPLQRPAAHFASGCPAA